MVNEQWLSTEHTRNMLTIVGKYSGQAADALPKWQRHPTRMKEEWIRRPVSRVLCRPLAETRRSFLWTGPCGTVLATYPEPSGRRRPYRISPARDPYSVLLLAGLAMRPLSPGTRCALTAPFHPYRAVAPRGEGGRSALCGAIPGVTPGGRYPPPCRRGARTFLDPLAGTATARPSDPRGPWSLRAPGSTPQALRPPRPASTRPQDDRQGRPRLRLYP